MMGFRLFSQYTEVNSSMNRLHYFLSRPDNHPCIFNSLCLCENLPNETSIHRINCHDVSFYKFTGKFSIFVFFFYFFHE